MKNIKLKWKSTPLGEVLQQVKNSKISINEAVKMISQEFNSKEMDFASIDLHRDKRTFIPEIIFCESKSLEQVTEIAKKIYAEKKIVIGTRCRVDYFKKLKRIFPNGTFSIDAQSFRIGKPLQALKKGKIGIISAGTTDISVCEEAAFILESLGAKFEKIYDVGVAGLHRLFSKNDKIKGCDVLIVAAGMEGALPSVVSGLYHQPLIAIPTNVGYGTALNGLTALFAMLTSCSPGVTVVNINNGVGAAAAAFKILKLIEKKSF